MPSNLAFLLNQAYSAHSRGQYEQAIEYYQQVLAQDPTHVEAHNGLGLALYDLARYPEAHIHFRAAADRNPLFPEAFYGLALVEKAFGNYDQAFSHLHSAKRLRPDYIDAIAIEAGLLEVIGRKREAFDLLAKFIDRGFVNTNLAVSFASVTAPHSINSPEPTAMPITRRM